MRTVLLTLRLAALALAACSSTPPFNDTTTGAAASSGGVSSGAAATGTSTGSAAGTGSGTGTTGGTTGTGAGATSSGSTTGPGVTPGTLWIGGAYALDPTALGMSATNPTYKYTCAPVATLANPAQGGAEVMDGLGQLWTQFYTSTPTDVLAVWGPGELVDSCSTRHPALTFNISQSNIAALAFDASGNLWASAPQSNLVLAYGASTLQVSGNIGPAYLLTANSSRSTSTLFNPTGLAFDTLGTLWVGNYYSILAYHAATLAQAQNNGAGNSLVPPDLVLTNPAAAGVESDGGIYNQFVYQYLAFDSSGDLWVTVQNYLNTPTTYQIIEFSATQLSNLATNSQPTPIFTINEDPGAAWREQPPGWSSIALRRPWQPCGPVHLCGPQPCLPRPPGGHPHRQWHARHHHHGAGRPQHDPRLHRQRSIPSPAKLPLIACKAGCS